MKSRTENWVRATWYALAIVVSALMGGCGGGGGTHTEGTVQGWAAANGPVGAAQVLLYDPSGNVIQQKDVHATSDFGSFMASVNDLPRDFRIVAEGGTVADEPFSGRLVADYRNFDANNGIVHINPVTTLVSAYLDKHPGLTLEDATAKVKKFLAMPDSFDIGEGANSSGEYFDHRTFMADALLNGGFQPSIKKLVDEIDSGPAEATHPFPSAASGGGMQGGGGVGMWVAEKLATGAVSYIGGEAMGWGLSQIGLGLDNQTAQLTQAIAQMQQQLSALSSQLDVLNSKMDQLSNQLVATEYDVRMGQVSQLIGAIKSIRGKMTIFVTSPPANKQLLETKRKEIVDLIKANLLGKETLLHDQLYGLPGQTPLLKLWSQKVKTSHRFLSSSDYATVKSMFDYFDALQAWQMEILVEYYHYTGEGAEYHAGIDSTISAYQANIQKQHSLLLNPIPNELYIYHNANYDLAIYQPENCDAAIVQTPAWAPSIVEEMTFFFPPVYEKRVRTTPLDLATTSFTGGMNGRVWEIVNVVRKMNLDQRFGYSDWRHPSHDNLRDMFFAWNSSGADSPGRYARAQGLIRMDKQRYIPAWQDPATCGTIDCEFQWAIASLLDTRMGFFHYDTSTGQFGWRNWQTSDRFNTMPVRQMTPSDMSAYFW